MVNEISEDEKKVLKGLESNKTLDDNLEFLVNKLNMSRGKITRIIYGLWKKGYIDLVPDRVIDSFSKYLISVEAANLYLIITIIIVNAVLVTFVTKPPLVYFRYVVGSIFVLFLPGYALIEALYPKEDELEALERFALSIGLSLALVPLVGLVLNYTPWGIRLEPITISLSLLTLLLYLYATYRKYSYYRLKYGV